MKDEIRQTTATRLRRACLVILLVLAVGSPLLAQGVQCDATDDPMTCGGLPPATCGGDHAFCEDLTLGRARVDQFNTWWSYQLINRTRGELKVALTGLGYEVWFPTLVNFDWDPQQVVPGNTFEVSVAAGTYNAPSFDEYLLVLPGFDISVRNQTFIWTFSDGWHWRTTWTLGYDFLWDFEFDFDDERPPDLGDLLNEFYSDVTIPTGPPGLSDLIGVLVTLNLRARHEMQDREMVAMPGAVSQPQGPPDAQVGGAAELLWDENFEAHTIPITLPDDYCHPLVGLNLDSQFNYDNRGSAFPTLKFFPGTDIEWAWEVDYSLQLILDVLDEAGLEEYTFFPNFWDGARNFQVDIPVDLKPDLCVNDFRLDWQQVFFPCVGGLPISYPVLVAEIENCGCIAIEEPFYVKFMGVNHGLVLEEPEQIYSVASPMDTGDTLTITHGPILLWDRQFRFIADSRDAIDEMDESNNTAQIDLAKPLLGGGGFPVYPPEAGVDMIQIQLPRDMLLGDPSVLTVHPDCADHQQGPFPVRDGNPVQADVQISVDFSYIYDGLGLTVAVPPDNVMTDDPGVREVTLTGGATSFDYEIWDATGSFMYSTETVEVTYGAPSPTLTVNPVLSPVPGLNMTIAGTTTDATEIECTVVSREGAVTHVYGPYTLSGPDWSFDDISLLEGDNSISVVARNAEGSFALEQLSVEADPRHDPTDVTPPEISIASPGFNPNSPCEVYVRNSEPLISAVIHDVDAANQKLGVGVDPTTVRLFLDGTRITGGVDFDANGQLRYQVGSPGLSQAQHALRIEASDFNGNPQGKTTIFCVDTIPPAITALTASPSEFEPTHAGGTEFPGNFPGPPPPSTIDIGTILSGSFVARATPDSAVVGGFEHVAILTGSKGSGVAAHREVQYTPESTSRSVMVISVEGADADTSYPIEINGVMLSGATLVTDAEGCGTVTFDDAYSGTNGFTDFDYTLSEDAAVTISLYAGIGVAGLFEEEEYRGSIHRDGVDSSGVQQYTPQGLNTKRFDGRIFEPGSLLDPTIANHELDTGVHSFVIRATDRAGNTNAVSGTFEVHHAGRAVDTQNSDFSLGGSTSSGCDGVDVSLRLRDGSGALIPGRIVAFRPASDRNSFQSGTAPVIDDIFFTGGTPQGRTLLAPTSPCGEIRFPVQGLDTGSANISLDYLIGGAIGTSQTLTTNAPLCSASVDTANSIVTVQEGLLFPCSPFVLEVELREDVSGNPPLEDANVSLRVESDRNTPTDTIDSFFEFDAAQGGYTPVYSGSELIQLGGDDDVDTRGKLVIPVLATQPGTVTYTVYLRQGASEAQLGSVNTELFGGCLDLPDPGQSDISVSPQLADLGQPVTVTITLRDDQGNPIRNKTFAAQATSDRNGAGTTVTEHPDLFGHPPGTSSEFVTLEATNDNGEIVFPVRSAETGSTVIRASILTPRGRTEIGSGAGLQIVDLPGIWLDPAASDFSLEASQWLPGDCANGTITLNDALGQPLANLPFGVRIKSDRNHRSATPWVVDHIRPGPCGSSSRDFSGGFETMMTGDTATIFFHVTSETAGTAGIGAEVLDDAIPVSLGTRVLSFGDTDFDGVPDPEDVCEGFDDLRDCDADGTPDGCDDSLEDDDSDGTSTFCDNCPFLANPDQSDRNANGRGDACDPCGNGTVDPEEACDGTSDASCPGACRIDCGCPALTPSEQLDRTARLIQQPGPVDSYPYWEAGVLGAGQTISIHDTGFSLDAGDMSHTATSSGWTGSGPIPDHRKVLAYLSDMGGDLEACDGPDPAEVGHGVVVAGTAIGSATRFVDLAYGNGYHADTPDKGRPGSFDEAFDQGFDGVAPGAKAVLWDLLETTPELCSDDAFPDLQPFDLRSQLDESATVYADATIHNLSFGDASNTYSTRASDVDGFQYDTDQSLVFVAAGDGGGPGTLSSLGNCKNCVVVGAAESLPSSSGWAIMDSSSEGPTPDGRSGVTLVAPGVGSSCKSLDIDQNDPVLCSEHGTPVAYGTSIATAAASGAGLLVRDHLAQGIESEFPVPSISGALTRALLIASTDPVSTTGPGYKPVQDHRLNPVWGYGVVNLSNVLPLSSHSLSPKGLVFSDFVGGGDLPLPVSVPLGPSGFSAFAEFEVVDSGRLAAVLAWNDPLPGPQLTNDLDLTLTYCGGDGDCDMTTDNVRWFGNWFTEDVNGDGILDPSEDLDSDDEIDASYRSLPTDLDGNGTEDITTHDDINSAEAIFLDASSIGRYRIEVSTAPRPVTDSQQLAVVVAGAVPVASVAGWDRPFASCNDQLSVVICETDDPADGGCSAAGCAVISGRVVVEVLDPGGVVVETESNLQFTPRHGAQSLLFDSAPLFTGGTQQPPANDDGVLFCYDNVRFRAKYADDVGGMTVVRTAEIIVPCADDCDQDGTTVSQDCDDENAGVWTAPEEVSNLELGADKETLTWSPDTGGEAWATLYDVIRAENILDFDAGGVCVEPDGSDTTATDPQFPVGLFYYVVRAQNACGQGTPGSGYQGERPARICP